jgi:hypothetical protein
MDYKQIGLITLFAILGLYLLSHLGSPSLRGTGNQALNFGAKTAQTATTTRVSTATTSLMTSNNNRDVGRLCLTPSSSLSTVVSLGLGNQGVAVDTGLYLSSSTNMCYQFDQTNPYIGSVFGIASNTSTWVNVLDY